MVALTPFVECVQIDDVGAVTVPVAGDSAPGSQVLLGGDPTLPNPNLVATSFAAFTYNIRRENTPSGPPTIVKTANEYELTPNAVDGDYEILSPLIAWSDTWKAARKGFTVQIEALTMRSALPFNRHLTIDLIDINGTVISSAESFNSTNTNPASWDDVMIHSLRLLRTPARNRFRVRVRINNLLSTDTFEINKLWLMLDPGTGTCVTAGVNDLEITPHWDRALVPVGTNWSVLWSAALLATPRPAPGFVGAPLALDQTIQIYDLTARDSSLLVKLSTANMVTFKQGFIQIISRPFTVAPSMTWRIEPRPLTV